MLKFNRLILALAFIGGSAVAQASEGSSTFGGVTFGSTSDKFSKSNNLNRNLNSPNADGIIGKDSTWGVRLGQQNLDNRYYATYDNVSGSHNGLKMRQENLLGSYDVFMPITATTKLFGGGTLGLTKLTQESRGASRDTGMGYAAGVQAGVLQQVAQNASLELGYRYLRSNASTEVSPHNAAKVGSLKLDSSAQTYLAANYHF